MNGIRILSTITEEVVVSHYWSFIPSFWSWFGLCCLVILVLGACWSVWKACDEGDGTWLILTLIILGTALIPIFCVFKHNITEEHYQYKVIAEDDVCLNEFFERYNLIDTDGVIYIVEDKEE